VFCIIGDERAYASRSPALFTAVIRRHGINGTYVPFNVAPEDLGRALQSVRILNMAGANVTVPYKEAVVPHVDVLSEGAQIIGAINTIVRVGDQLKGYNTNAIGFMDALLSTGFEVEGRSALVIGTGGAARAVAFIFNWLRTRSIVIAGRDARRTALLAERFGAEARPLGEPAAEHLDVEVVVNATPVSGVGESPELEAQLRALPLRGCRLVVDLNYDRPHSLWEDLARAHGAQLMDGFTPLAHQAKRTFALWTGLQVPVGEFKAALQAPEAGAR
jgi:shikimate dehydrogenase